MGFKEVKLVYPLPAWLVVAYAMLDDWQMVRKMMRGGRRLSKAALPQRVSTKTCPCIADNDFSCAL